MHASLLQKVDKSTVLVGINSFMQLNIFSQKKFELSITVNYPKMEGNISQYI